MAQLQLKYGHTVACAAVKSVQYIKSPLNYIGGKYRILGQILPLFPNKINNFVDLFAGGYNVGINIDSQKIFLNDNLVYLIKMYEAFRTHDLNFILGHIEKRIEQFDLSLQNAAGYLKMRELYNKEKHPLDLFVLIAYSFNHQIRFNSRHDFNNPFGKERSCFNRVMRSNLEIFISKFKNQDVVLSSTGFEEFNCDFLSAGDMVYCDPPYLITTGTYNDGKRGFTGWSEREEKLLLQKLDLLDSKGVRFALSNVLDHKQRTNDLLKTWLALHTDYRVNRLEMNYSNSNYQTINRDKNASTEVLITNYAPSSQKASS